VKKLLSLLLGVSLVLPLTTGFGAQPVRADDGVAAGIGGFLGGLTGSLIRNGSRGDRDDFDQVSTQKKRSGASKKIKPGEDKESRGSSQNRTLVRQVLAANGLVLVDGVRNCTAMVGVLVGNDVNPYCAVANANFPAGLYRLDPAQYRLIPLTQATNPSIGQPGTILGNQVWTPTQTTLPPVPIYFNANPTYPVPYETQQRIQNLMVAQGLSLLPCNTPNVATFMFNGSYIACANPTPAYLGGQRYSFSVAGL
jgi:hypothetical protein